MLALLCALAVAAAPALTKPPSVRTEQAPLYPDDAKAAGEEGDVVLAVTIGEDGLPQYIVVKQSAGARLDWAALGALAGFTFAPAEWDGVPGPAVVDYTMSFRVDAAAPAPTPPVDVAQQGPPPAVRAPTALSGRVRRAGTVRALVGAEVAVTTNLPPDRGGRGESFVVYADEEGRFRVDGLTEGPWHVAVALEGYDVLEIDRYLEPNGALELDLALVPKRSTEFETVVRARRTLPSVSSVSLSRAEVRAVPGTYGDALRVLESLPGVARAPLLGGALMVRGGVPADTGIFMDGVPVPVLYHFGGFTSVVNSSFLETIDFFPGGFSPRYGNATAGVVEVESHALDMEVFEGRADVDLMDVGFFLGGPIHVPGLPKARVGFAARRSHLEGPAAGLLLLLGAFRAPLTFLPVPVYDDWQTKLEVDLATWAQASFFAFGANDQFAIVGEPPDDLLGAGVDLDLEDLLNDFVGSRFRRWVGTLTLRPLPGLQNTTTGWFGDTRRGLLSDGVVVPLLSGATIDTPQRSDDAGLRDELQLRVFPWLRATAGLDFVWSRSHLTVLDVEATPGTTPSLLDVAATTTTAGLYGALAVGPIGGLTLVPGARVELGEVVYQAGDGARPYDGLPRSVLPTTSVDPRVSARWEWIDGFALKGAFGTYSQRPRLQSGALDVDGTPLSMIRALHVIGGIEQRLAGDFTLDAQVYGVRRLSLVRDASRFWSPEQAFLPPISVPGSFDSFGRGGTLGFELLLRQQPTKTFYGWIAYTFSRTDVSIGDQREPIVPSSFDQTHNLVLVGRYVLPWEFTLGGRFQFATGNPGPIAGSITTLHDLNTGSYTPVLSSLRRPRLAPFHRLDVRVDKKFTTEWSTLVVYLDVINVYNWPNPEVVFPGGDFRAREVRTLLPGPPFLPLFGVEGEF